MRGAIILTEFIAGLLVGYFIDSYIYLIIIGIFSIAIITAAILMGRNPLNIPLTKRMFVCGIGFLFFTLGCLDSYIRKEEPLNINSDTNYIITGVVESRRTLTSGEMYSLKLREINRQSHSGSVTLFTNSDSQFHPGEIICYKSKIELKETHLFAVSNLITSCYNSQSIRVIGESRNLKYRLMGISMRIDDLVGYSHLNQDTKALLRALILGDRIGITPDKTALMRNGGTIHALALSGMHIGILAAIFLFITRPLVITLGRKWRLAVILIGIWIFVLMTGAAYSALRAAIMISITMLAIMAERKRDPFTSVCFATLFILVLSPEALFDVGLQLSFVSVAALSLMMDPLNPIDHRNHPKTYRIFTLILSTIIATAATWALCGFYFGNAPIRFIPSNIVMLPVLPIFLGLGLLHVFLCTIGLESHILILILDAIPKYLYLILDKIVTQAVDIFISPAALATWMGALIFFAAYLRFPDSRKEIAGATATIKLKKNILLIAFFISLIASLIFMTIL